MKLSSSGDAYFQIKESESNSKNPNDLEIKNQIKNEENIIIEEKHESQDFLNSSTESPGQRKSSAPSTPSKMSKHFEKLNSDDCKKIYFLFFQNFPILLLKYL
jgi:hypothetical protein